MKQLFVWNWIGGGYNQTYAVDANEAVKEAKRIWPSGKVDMSTLRVEKNEADYWKMFLTLD